MHEGSILFPDRSFPRSSFPEVVSQKSARASGPTGAIMNHEGVHRGCQLRRLRQGPKLRAQHLSLAPTHEASLEPEHSAGPHARRQDPEASKRVRLVPEGRQGRAQLARRLLARSWRVRQARPVLLRLRPAAPGRTPVGSAGRTVHSATVGPIPARSYGCGWPLKRIPPSARTVRSSSLASLIASDSLPSCFQAVTTPVTRAGSPSEQEPGMTSDGRAGCEGIVSSPLSHALFDGRERHSRARPSNPSAQAFMPASSPSCSDSGVPCSRLPGDRLPCDQPAEMHMTAWPLAPLAVDHHSREPAG